MKVPDFLWVGREKQKRQHDSYGECQADQAFGQNVERNGYGDSPAQPSGRLWLFTCHEKKIQSEGEEDCDDHFRDEKAREYVKSWGSNSDKCRVKSSFFAKKSSPEYVDTSGQDEDAKSKWKTRLPF